MTLAELSMLAGFPSALSIISISYDGRFKNAHYVAVGAWAGVFLRYYDMNAPSLLVAAALAMTVFHLGSIIHNERIMEKLKKGVWRERRASSQVLLTEKDQGDRYGSQERDDHLEDGDQSGINTGQVGSSQGGQGARHHCGQNVQTHSNSDDLLQDLHLHS